MSVKTVGAEEVQRLLDAGKPVVVDFAADWCRPCHALAPEIETLAAAFAGDIAFVKIDVDAEPVFAQQHGVMSVPTVVHFSSDGTELARSIGLRNAAQLASALELDPRLAKEETR